jgi:hypothetical protein
MRASERGTQVFTDLRVPTADTGLVFSLVEKDVTAALDGARRACLTVVNMGAKSVKLNADLSAVGISDRYRIVLLDEAGRQVGTLAREPGPQRISARERAFLEGELAGFVKSKGWPARVGRELAKKIPSVRNPVRAVRVAPGRVFVFRFAADIGRGGAPVPVDVFTRRGELIGTAETAEVPLHVSGKALYFVRTDDGGNVFLARRTYSISPVR